MADKKVYTIQINGIKESYENISSLSDALKKVDETTKESKASSSELEKIQQKLAEYDRQYATELAKAKQALAEKNKETKDSIKHENDIQVIEANSAKTYKEKQTLLSALGRVIKSTNAETDEEKQKLSELVARYNEVNDELKNFDKNIGNYQRNVGNYTSAFDAFDSSGQTMKDRLKEITEQMALMAANGDKSSDAFRALAQEGGAIKDAMADAKASINDFANDTKQLSNVIDVAKTATSAFGLLQSATAAFGIENENVVKSIQQMQAAMTMLNSLQQIQSQLLDNSSGTYQLYHKILRMIGIEQKSNTAATAANTAAQGANAAAMGAATVAATALRVALAAIGIGIIIGLVSALVENWKSLVNGFLEMVGISGGLSSVMETLSSVFDTFKQVISGVGNALFNYFITPFKTVTNTISGFINGGIKGAIKGFTSTIKEGTDVVANYKKGKEKEITKQQLEEIKKREKAELSNVDYELELAKKKYGNDYQYTAAGNKLFREKIELMRKMYANDKEELKKINLLVVEYNKGLHDYQDNISKGEQKKIDEKKKAAAKEADEKKKAAAKEADEKKKAAAKEADERQKQWKKEQEDLKKFQQENITLQREMNEEKLKEQEKQILGLNIISQEGLKKQAALLESNSEARIKLVNERLHEELSILEEEYKAKMKAYEKLGKDTTELTEAYEQRQVIITNKYANEKADIANGVLETIAKNQKQFNEKQFNDEKAHLKEMGTQLQSQLQNILNANSMKDIKHKGGFLDGVVDANATIKQLNGVRDALNKFKIDANEEIENYKTHLEKAKELYGENSEEYKKTSKEIEAAIASLMAQIKKADDGLVQVDENANKAVKSQRDGVLKKTEEYMNVGSDLIQGSFDAISTFMSMAIEEMQEKLSELDEMHSNAVEKVEESQNAIQSLNEEIANASGARFDKLKEQLADEQVLLKQRQAEEARIAKEKQKMEENIRKKEKQQKKIEAVQSLISAGINTALGITKALSLTPPMSWIMAATTGALGAVQIATIASQMSKLEKGGLIGENGISRSHRMGGHKIENTNIEVEGGEFVINKKSTSRYEPLIRAINADNQQAIIGYLSSIREGKTITNNYYNSNSRLVPTTMRMYANGGVINTSQITSSLNDNSDISRILNRIDEIDIQPVVSVVDIERVQKNLTRVRELSGK